LQIADGVNAAEVDAETPATMTRAPMRRAASMVCTMWLATRLSTDCTPVMSMTTTLARLARIERSSCSVSWRARCASMMPMIGTSSRPSRNGSTGVGSSWIASCCSRIVRSRDPI
jgi:hypothetical protein